MKLAPIIATEHVAYSTLKGTFKGAIFSQDPIHVSLHDVVDAPTDQQKAGALS